MISENRRKAPCIRSWARVSFNANAGQTYLIRLTAWSYSEGEYIISLTGPPCDSGGIPGDLDGDGLVDFNDLLVLLAAWGPCADCDDCPADLDGDCTVGFADLLVVLSNWS